MSFNKPNPPRLFDLPHQQKNPHAHLNPSASNSFSSSSIGNSFQVNTSSVEEDDDDDFMQPSNKKYGKQHQKGSYNISSSTSKPFLTKGHNSSLLNIPSSVERALANALKPIIGFVMRLIPR